MTHARPAFRPLARLAPFLVVMTASACGVPLDAPVPASRFGADSTLWMRMLEAEDARGSGNEGLTPLFDGVRSTNPTLRAIAVRGLGRLERADLADSIISVLGDADVDVRTEAANALAQASRAAASTAVRAALEARIPIEADTRVLAVLAESLGRLPHEDVAAAAATASVLTRLAVRDSANARRDPTVPLGVARGFYFLARQPASRPGLPDDAIGALRWLATSHGGNDGLTATRLRSVATAALVAARAVGVEDIEKILTDPEASVRREAVVAISTVDDPGIARHLAERVFDDEDSRVRYEALRVWDRVRDTESRCQETLDAAHDRNAHVALLAIDLLGSDCGGQQGGELLDSLAGALRPATAAGDTGWQRGAHAMVSLARASGRQARERLPSFIEAANPFVRAYAARAAVFLREVPALERLAADADANVRTEAVRGLSTVIGHAADSIYVAQLNDQTDSQLLQAASAALEGSTRPGVAEALLDAFERVSTARRETWRDSRAALLSRVAQLGSPALAGRLEPLLGDYDAQIADSAAALIGRWTGTTVTAHPQRLPRMALPTPADVEAMVRTALIIEMQDGGTIGIELFPFVAPANAWRFVRLARDGYYDGLTLHRVVPNFVVQGGSPAANEYAGDGPYSRDELGLSYNWRGAVGLSTRGRDTGDGQLYINLIDNVRLDHDYTIWGRVIEGMPIVDALLEGAVIRSITLERVRR